ncbi:MAG TPA: hypothetical protein VNF73_13890 [Candidatus Saccharimonadales bacterium]|nr:hypothetical protein [Candidatus Saccharimonadales bacterium]
MRVGETRQPILPWLQLDGSSSTAPGTTGAKGGPRLTLIGAMDDTTGALLAAPIRAFAERIS